MDRYSDTTIVVSLNLRVISDPVIDMLRDYVINETFNYKLINRIGIIGRVLVSRPKAG